MWGHCNTRSIRFNEEEEDEEETEEDGFRKSNYTSSFKGVCQYSNNFILVGNIFHLLWPAGLQQEN